MTTVATSPLASSPELWSRFDDACRMREPLSISEWAARHRIVARGPLQGYWDNDVSPYAVEIMDAYLDPAVWKVVVVGPTQASKTEAALLNPLLYYLLHLSWDVVFMIVTQSLCTHIWRTRIKPAIEDSPALRDYMLPTKLQGSRGEYYFANGACLTMVGANSIGALASRSFPVAFADEVDKYEPSLKEEADPLSLLIRRTDAYSSIRKVGITCTVTSETGRIWQQYLRGDQRQYWMPCPECGEPFLFRYDDLRYDPNAGSDQARINTYYECPHCQRHIVDAEKSTLMRRGRWKPSNARPEVGTRSYHYNALYSPFRTFGELAAEIIDARDEESALLNVQHSSMVIPYTPSAPDKVTHSMVMAHQEGYEQGEKPEGVHIITGGIDVQARVLYYVLRGWAADTSSWLILYGVLDRHGPLGPALDRMADVFEPYSPALVLIDSGYETDAVYKWVRAQGQMRYIAYKGWSGGPPFQRRMQKEFGVKRCDANADIWKLRVHKLLRISRNNPGYFALPQNMEFYYGKHLTAEEWREDEIKKGKLIKAHWERIRKPNHLFDCEAMACCAAGIRGLFRTMRPKTAAVPTEEPALMGMGVTDDDRAIVASILREARQGI